MAIIFIVVTLHDGWFIKQMILLCINSTKYVIDLIDMTSITIY